MSETKQTPAAAVGSAASPQLPRIPSVPQLAEVGDSHDEIVQKSVEVNESAENAAALTASDNLAAHAAQKEAHLATLVGSMRRYPKIVGWIVVMLWVLILMGFDNSAGGQVISVVRFRQNFGSSFDGQFLLSASWQSAIQAGPTAMNVVGLYVGSYLSDHFGPRWIMTGTLCVSMAAIGVEYDAKSIETFFAGKMVNGFCLGIFSALCVAYVAEIAPLPLRGIATGGCNLSQTLGSFVGSLLGYFVGSRDDDWSYKALFVAQWVFGGSALLIQPFMPDSPWFHLKKGHEAKARRALARLCSTDEDAEAQLNVLKLTLAEAAALTGGASYWQCFQGTNRRRTLIACLTFFTHPMSGVSFISSYGPFIYQLLGIQSKLSFQIGVGAQVLSIAGTLISFLFVDRFGRRPLILGGLTALMCNLLSTGIAGTQAKKSKAAQTACVAFLTMFNFFYNGGIGAIAYTITSEIPTSVLRTKTVAIALSINQGFGTMWTFVLPFIINPDEGNLGAKVAFIFFGLSCINLVLLYIYLPEIADRTYEELDELFGNKVTARKFKSYVTSAEVRADEAYVVTEKTREVEHVEWS